MLNHVALQIRNWQFHVYVYIYIYMFVFQTHSLIHLKEMRDFFKRNCNFTQLVQS